MMSEMTHFLTVKCPQLSLDQVSLKIPDQKKTSMSGATTQASVVIACAFNSCRSDNQ